MFDEKDIENEEVVENTEEQENAKEAVEEVVDY